MKEKKNFYQAIEELCQKDNRYKADAYEFVMQSLHFTQDRLKRETHVTGRELAEGIKELVVEQYGPMAKIVLNHWGITKTMDFGKIVFNMIDEKLLSKTESDSIEDFKDVYDFDSAFSNVLRNSVIKEIE